MSLRFRYMTAFDLIAVAPAASLMPPTVVRVLRAPGSIVYEETADFQWGVIEGDHAISNGSSAASPNGGSFSK